MQTPNHNPGTEESAENLPEHGPAQKTEHPAIMHDHLVEAAEQIFAGQTALPYEQYLTKLCRSYAPLHLADYAEDHNYSDAVLLTDLIKRIREQLEQNEILGESVQGAHRQLLVIGAGDGRLLEVYVQLARKIGIERIVMNDLMDAHVDAIEEKAKSLYGTDGWQETDGVKLQLLRGDFRTADIAHKQYAIAIAFWFVANEFLDPSSSTAMHQHRRAIYRKIHAALVDGGAYVEDGIDVNHPGFYETARRRSEEILGERGILYGNHQNLMLTSWKHEQEPEYFPYQIRFTGHNGHDNHEKEDHGFHERYAVTSSLPVSAKVDLETASMQLQRSNTLGEALESMQATQAASVTFPEKQGEKPQNIRYRKTTWWERQDSA